MQVYLLGFLGVCSWQDARRKSIGLYLLVSLLIGAVAYQLALGDLEVKNWLSGAALGLALLGIGAISRQQIGYGDGLLFVATGILLGFWNNLMLLFIALCLCSLVSLVLLGLKRANRKSELPFVPFVLTAYVILLGVGGIS